MTIPAQKDSDFYAIFGKYPPFTVQPGDRFQAVLACAASHPNCDISFSLEYYISGSTILQVPDAKWDKQVDPEGRTIYADASLDPLAGQTVQFLLTVRDNGDADDDYAVWIMPHIARLGSAATDALPPHQLNITNIEMVNVAGTVDMSSAPPYLYDDHPPGSPASVVLFDLDSDLFFTVSTKNTHPYFSLDVDPGQYYVLAYSYGIGDMPYVSGAFTDVEPSWPGHILMNGLPASDARSIARLMVSNANARIFGSAAPSVPFTKSTPPHKLGATPISLSPLLSSADRTSFQLLSLIPTQVESSDSSIFISTPWTSPCLPAISIRLNTSLFCPKSVVKVREL